MSPSGPVLDMSRIGAVAIVMVLLAACSDEGGAPGAGAPGLVRNPAFERDERGGLPDWTFVSHARGGSYRFEAGDGELRIERVGPEPWGQAVQWLPAEPLLGRQLTFSAEIALSQPAERSGLGVRVMGFEPGVPRALGESILLIERSESAPGEGWQPHRIDFTVPQGAIRVELALRHAGDGVLRARRPSLIVR
jgi:hypothetical protein